MKLCVYCRVKLQSGIIGKFWQFLTNELNENIFKLFSSGVTTCTFDIKKNLMQIQVIKFARHHLTKCDKHLMVVVVAMRTTYGPLITLPKYFECDVHIRFKIVQSF